MKISGDKLNAGHDVHATTGPDAASKVESTSRRPSTAPGAAAGDQITLSPETRILRAATEAAAQAPAARPEVVARMKALLESGELGRDADSLANAMIDNWINGL